MCVFHHYSQVFVPSRAIWSSLFSCSLPFSRSFLSECSFPFPFRPCLRVRWSRLYCSFHEHSMSVFHNNCHVFVLCRVIWSPLFSCPLIFSRPFSFTMFPSCPFLLCLVGSLIYSCCCFHGHSMCVFHHYSHVFVLCRVIWSPLFSCPLIFSRPFFFTMFPSFPFLLCLVGSLIYICCCFHGHSMCVSHHYSHVLLLCRVIWSPLFSYPLIFSRLFLSQCSFPFLLFYVFLSHWSIFAVISTGILCVSFTTFLLLSFPNVPSLPPLLCLWRM